MMAKLLMILLHVAAGFSLRGSMMAKLLMILPHVAAGFSLRGSNSTCLSEGATCALDDSLPPCCETFRCWEYMAERQPALELPGLTCTSCIAAGETCSRDIISGTPCCTGYICGASNGTDACVKMPEAVAAPMGDDETNFTKCGCPDHEYCPGAPPPNGHCGWLGALGFACGNPAGSRCAPEP